MLSDLWDLYRLMLKSRLFEESIAHLWHEGKISGEMHLGTGEEAIIAGVVGHLQEGDAMALDHRGTAALLMRGVSPELILLELLGSSKGLCGGMGGHMHLFSREHLASSSGIVGASGPAAVGFALAGQILRPKSVAVAFIGEGSMNQGMLMESLNLAATWNLPVLFVCKDDDWAITTKPRRSTSGDLDHRARGLGVEVVTADGLDVMAVWDQAGRAIERARSGLGPTFLHARCVHLEGHFLGLQTMRLYRNPLKELPSVSGPMVRSLFHPRGAPLRERISGLGIVMNTVIATLRDPRRDLKNDPLWRARKLLEEDANSLQEMEYQVHKDVDEIVTSVLEEVAR